MQIPERDFYSERKTRCQDQTCDLDSAEDENEF